MACFDWNIHSSRPHRSALRRGAFRTHLTSCALYSNFGNDLFLLLPKLVSHHNIASQRIFTPVASQFIQKYTGKNIMNVFYAGKSKALSIAVLLTLPLMSAAEEHNVAAEVETMSEVSVSADQDQDAPSEQTHSYTVKNSTTATRLNTGIKETPQSISVVTREQLDDFRVLTINDALSYATGIKAEPFETDRTDYTARGFDITNFQIDGISTPITYGTNYGDLDLATYDRIEVLRGANGLLTATGNPSATINFIRKRPTKDFQAKVDVSLGSWNNQRLDADVSGAINEDGSVRGRLVAAHQNKDSYLDRYRNEKNVFYGVIEADITDNTSVTLGHTYQQNDSDGNNWGSLPLLYADGSKRHYKVSDSTAPDWSYWNVGTNITFAELTHYFENDWKLKTQLTRKKTVSDARLHYIYGNEDSTTGLGLFSWPGMYHTETEDIVADIYVNGPFALAGRQHELVFGATWSKADVLDYGRQGTIGTALSSFESAADFPLPTFGTETKNSDFTTKTTNIYAAAKLNPMDSLKVTIGGSLLSYDMEGFSYGAQQDASENNKVTPYIGAVYDLNDIHALYASYTGIYKPQAEVGADFKALAPLKGKNYEMGIKSEWFNNKLNSSFALFKTEQENVAQEIGTVGVNTIYEGIKATSKGYEFDVSGEVTDRLSVNAGYSRLTSIKGDEDQNVNTYIPKHLVHLSTVYRTPFDEKLKVGASINWQSDIHVDIGSVRYEQNSYATLNLMANYKIDDHWSVAVNLYNVTNEKYLASMKWASSGTSYYAAPFNGLATLTWRY
jgi:outer-membrane receptor for ferric coprogen and ferric-rhodotorulic acid